METRAYINQPYGTPALNQGPPQAVIITNQNPGVVNPDMFKTHPVALTCMFCKKPMTTNVNTTCNVCACLLCYLTGIAFYVCVQACRGRDLCCYDAEHRCPHCNNVVGTYTAC